ncbi:protein of unknown function [Candidatus Promineifilum breve]|uniref:Uncharacterized protein n=1 Tax=Candidatus Promineifilum breve TaxID=1806508 RepID=A0A160TAN1_9CHLR|nr:protein of unknown function [Candidatus Promineifilum breve]
MVFWRAKNGAKAPDYEQRTKKGQATGREVCLFRGDAYPGCLTPTCESMFLRRGGIPSRPTSVRLAYVRQAVYPMGGGKT